MIKTRHLSKIFDQTRALDQVDLDVASGEIYCLLGANGAGKTTLINILLNFVEATEGNAWIDEIDVAARPREAKRQVGYIPEQVTLYPTLSGIENLDYFVSLAAGQRLERTRLLELLEDAGLDRAAADRRVAKYSKGMRQKVGIAIAFAKEAKALLLDEPTSGLDPQAANEFSRLLKKAGERGVAILMATHDLFNAKQTGTRIGIARAGRIVKEISARDIGHADLEAVYLDVMRA
ncbi:ABC transporter ATP-binding protein [Methylocystis bryophila]|uniref:ABC transporter ATP-binding protein n=1 Tax=Methylocystis bryophila TaxID=655015 RepID=A0A1W6N238_9HYPH|nr:ABC transporter ATP-binding protein [Methylocystis bryophila]ARN83897.1 ABC transporter ATP-binding protein [Methylocystis bryophila]BDV40985.1 ABC transporter ATP-binding protein [Methylocystis bryophila]